MVWTVLEFQYALGILLLYLDIAGHIRIPLLPRPYPDVAKAKTEFQYGIDCIGIPLLPRPYPDMASRI